MSDIYDLHDKAFQQVAAYVVLKDGKRVATIAFKRPKDGAGRLWAYVHWLGIPMVRGWAGGGGYDKRTAAIASAVASKAFLEGVRQRKADQEAHGAITSDYHLLPFIEALKADSGPTWCRALREVGFDIFQAV